MKEQEALYEQTENEIKLIKGSGVAEKNMVAKSHSCPGCGSSNLESYKDDENLIIKCENCGKVIKSRRIIPLNPEIRELKKLKEKEESILRRVWPTFLAMMIFTVIFALAMRFIISYFGLGI